MILQATKARHKFQPSKAITGTDEQERNNLVLAELLIFSGFCSVGKNILSGLLHRCALKKQKHDVKRKT